MCLYKGKCKVNINLGVNFYYVRREVEWERVREKQSKSLLLLAKATSRGRGKITKNLARLLAQTYIHTHKAKLRVSTLTILTLRVALSNLPGETPEYNGFAHHSFFIPVACAAEWENGCMLIKPSKFFIILLRYITTLAMDWMVWCGGSVGLVTMFTLRDIKVYLIKRVSTYIPLFHCWRMSKLFHSSTFVCMQLPLSQKVQCKLKYGCVCIM